MNFIEQCKGKDLKDVAASRLISDDTKVIASTKYDGNYIQIHKEKAVVRFFTSGGKEFYWQDLAFAMMQIVADFKIECEYIGLTDGKLGSRGECSTGTDRAAFKNGSHTNLLLKQIRVFDLLDTDLDAHQRKLYLKKLFNDFTIWLEVVDFSIMTFGEAKLKTKELIKHGWEGMMVQTLDHKQLPGKRVNNCIKLKSRPTADLLCIEVNLGEGKYEGMIGSLRLQDSTGRVVDVGSGLTDADRAKSPEEFLNKVIEIGYEQIIDTYIQPVFVCVRGALNEE